MEDVRQADIFGNIKMKRNEWNKFHDQPNGINIQINI